jgi:hypothetical protein
MTMKVVLETLDSAVEAGVVEAVVVEAVVVDYPTWTTSGQKVERIRKARKVREKRVKREEIRTKKGKNLTLPKSRKLRNLTFVTVAIETRVGETRVTVTKKAKRKCLTPRKTHLGDLNVLQLQRKRARVSELAPFPITTKAAHHLV